MPQDLSSSNMESVSPLRSEVPDNLRPAVDFLSLERNLALHASSNMLEKSQSSESRGSPVRSMQIRAANDNRRRADQFGVFLDHLLNEETRESGRAEVTTYLGQRIGVLEAERQPYLERAGSQPGTVYSAEEDRHYFDGQARIQQVGRDRERIISTGLKGNDVPMVFEGLSSIEMRARAEMSDTPRGRDAGEANRLGREAERLRPVLESLNPSK